jgi:hypothetical protein
MAGEHDGGQDRSDGESAGEQRPSLLDRTISYPELLDDGALEIYPQVQLRRWFRDRETMSVGEALGLRTHVGWIFWAIMRTEVLPGRAMHLLAAQYAREFLTRMTTRGTYIDFRTERALTAKEAWLDEQISLGELSAARDAARRAYDDVADYGDQDVSACAAMVLLALAERGQDAQRQAFYFFQESFPLRADQRWLLRRAKATLAARDLAFA